MLATLFVLVCLFGLTVFATGLYHQKQEALARRWFERGQADLKRGFPRQAIADFENSLLYARDNDVYRLSLAEALLANKEPEQARAHLLNLWSDNPESGTVNRELGRLYAQEADVPHAVRYYHNAIYGIWKFAGNPDQNRLKSRLELCQFLVNQNQKTLAQAELVALAGELPAKPDLHAKVGDWFRRAGDDERALAEYRQALRLDPNQQDALVGAGEVAFQVGGLPSGAVIFGARRPFAAAGRRSEAKAATLEAGAQYRSFGASTIVGRSQPTGYRGLWRGPYPTTGLRHSAWGFA